MSNYVACKIVLDLSSRFAKSLHHLISECGNSRSNSADIYYRINGIHCRFLSRSLEERLNFPIHLARICKQCHALRRTFSILRSSTTVPAFRKFSKEVQKTKNYYDV